ncbi:hypothetical protein C8F04DRAFT_1267196 [Mycena alexandri]|uniref:Uncharacterized protein n=1 Tax=Mycena alexandri TaxID=1745969 RepID=A0AAD6SGV3_9AGAR|nr:hypothetical protein C8F04DRAFT_1267196 [Mycena alexandri]
MDISHHSYDDELPLCPFVGPSIRRLYSLVPLDTLGNTVHIQIRSPHLLARLDPASHSLEDPVQLSTMCLTDTASPHPNTRSPPPPSPPSPPPSLSNIGLSTHRIWSTAVPFSGSNSWNRNGGDVPVRSAPAYGLCLLDERPSPVSFWKRTQNRRNVAHALLMPCASWTGRSPLTRLSYALSVPLLRRASDEQREGGLEDDGALARLSQTHSMIVMSPCPALTAAPSFAGVDVADDGAYASTSNGFGLLRSTPPLWKLKFWLIWATSRLRLVAELMLDASATTGFQSAPGSAFAFGGRGAAVAFVEEEVGAVAQDYDVTNGVKVDANLLPIPPPPPSVTLIIPAARVKPAPPAPIIVIRPPRPASPPTGAKPTPTAERRSLASTLLSIACPPQEPICVVRRTLVRVPARWLSRCAPETLPGAMIRLSRRVALLLLAGGG